MAKRVKKLPSNLRYQLDYNIEQEMQAMARTARANIVNQNSIASARLGAKTRHVDFSNNPRYSGFSTHAVSSQTGYARFVEYGTGVRGEGRYKSPSRPPPIDDIVQWIVQKGIKPVHYDTIYGLAKAIQMVIKEFGNHSNPFMRPAWKQHRGGLTTAHRRSVRRALRSL